MQPLFDQCNDNLTYLRKVFKRYQKKNERKLSDEEIRARSKTLDILRKQLNLLLEELELQDQRFKPNPRTAQTKKKGGQREFIDLFGINSDPHEMGEQDDEEERDLSAREKEILKEFEENDQDQELIAGEIVKALEGLKGTAETIETTIDKQGNLLKSTRARSEAQEVQLSKQNNELKKIIEKHKNGKQCCFDLGLIFIFLALAVVEIKLLQSKGYLGG